MAACMGGKMCLRITGLSFRFLGKSNKVTCNYQLCNYSSSSAASNQASLSLFNTDEVQHILKRITGMDLQKIYRHSKQPLEAPTYRLVSDTKLKELEEEARLEAQRRLQMPPVLEERSEITDILSEDKELEGLDSSKFVFTDITYGINDRERFVVVREPCGNLRKATWEERDRISQIYFPQPHRQLVAPSLFSQENMSLIFSQDRHEDLLDATCGQFQPDAAEFIQVHEYTYKDIEARDKYDLLRSTRHFGGLAFHLTRTKQIDGLLADMMQRNVISDAVDLIALYHIVNPECKSAVEVKDKGHKGINVIKAFIEMDSQRQGRLELILQAYENELQAAQGRASEDQEASESQR